MFSIFGEGLGCDFERGFCGLAAAAGHARGSGSWLFVDLFRLCANGS